MGGRTEELKDIFINGKVDPEGIHASFEALEETQRLQGIFDERVQQSSIQSINSWKISYLNVRNGIKCHYGDVSIDNYLLSSDIFAIGETCLEPEETVKFTGFNEHFASHGNGKGVAVFSKMECTNSSVVNSFSSSIFSAIHFRTIPFDIIFVYWSSGCTTIENTEVLNLLEKWIVNERPTAIMGDMNSNFSENCRLNIFLKQKGFEQQVKEATCETGSLIDHIYINEELKKLNLQAEKSAAYYSDHDIITLHISKCES